MSQTVLVENNPDLKKLFSINLQTYTGSDVIERESARQVIDLLSILPSVSLIITRNKIDGEDTAKEIYQFVKRNSLDIPIIVLGENIELASEVLQLKTPTPWESLVRHASLLLGVTEEELKNKIKPNFIPISLNYFYEIDHTPCDIYIRIKKTPQEYQFVKRLHAQDSFLPEDIDKYYKQGLRNFYVPKDYQQYFVTYVTNSILTRIESDLPITSRLVSNANAYEIVKEHLATAGVTQEIADLTEATINSMIKSINASPKLANLLKFLFSSKISYAYQKAHLVCVLGNFTLKKQKWYKKEHLELFTRLAFMADITLKSSKQMRVNSIEDLKNADLSEKERNEVLEHALRASELTREFKNYDSDIETAVLQHQGAIDGIGLPSDPHPDINPISKVFVVADAFVKLMLDPVNPKSKREILTILYMHFTSSDYQKLIKVLEHKIE